MIKELNVIIAVLIFLGSTNSSYVKALPFIDDDNAENRVERNLTYRIPTADDIAQAWILSSLNKTLNEADKNRYEIYENGKPKIFQDSFRISEDWMIKKYCIVSKAYKNCMEVGLNPIKEIDTPLEIRIRANPKKIEKTKKFEKDEEAKLTGKMKHKQMKHMKYYKNYDKKDDKYIMTDGRKLSAKSGQTITVIDNYSRDKRNKRSFSHEESDEPSDSSADKSNNVFDSDGRVKRKHDTSDYTEEDYTEEEEDASPSIEDPSEEDEHSPESDPEPESSEELSEDASDASESIDADEMIVDPLLDSNPSHSNQGELMVGSAEDSPYLWTNCRLPDRASNAEILCKKWPHAISCHLYCAHGYTFREGIKRKTHCRFTEGKWTKKFEQCQPFIDCTVVLEEPGTLSCTTHHLKQGTTCTISCNRSSKEDSVERQKYTCTNDGRFSPSLPHCANQEGIDVVKPPSVTQHRDVIYPDKYPSFIESDYTN